MRNCKPEGPETLTGQGEIGRSLWKRAPPEEGVVPLQSTPYRRSGRNRPVDGAQPAVFRQTVASHICSSRGRPGGRK